MSRRVELLADLDRDSGRWLLVDGSEQSYLDVADPRHLEFEYIQFMAQVLANWRSPPSPIRALHLGGGLATLPRLIAAEHPGSEQLIVEASQQIAEICRSVPLPEGIELVVADAIGWLGRRVERSDPQSRYDLIVVDMYDGPETVTGVFTLPALRGLANIAAEQGLVLVNLSDATPFRLARSVAAAMCEVWTAVVAVAEPPVLRGRRSGNVVLAGADDGMDVSDLVRRCASGATRGRVMTGEGLREWVGASRPAEHWAALPMSAEAATPLFGASDH